MNTVFKLALTSIIFIGLFLTTVVTAEDKMARLKNTFIKSYHEICMKRVQVKSAESAEQIKTRCSCESSYYDKNFSADDIMAIAKAHKTKQAPSHIETKLKNMNKSCSSQ